MARISRRFMRVLMATFIGLAAGCFHRVDPTPARHAMLGRWMLTLHIMGGLFRTPMELLADSSGMLRVANLGVRLVQFDRVGVENGVLRLQGASRLGRAHVSGHLTGDSLQSRWRIKILRGDVTGHKRRHAAMASAGIRP